jgi:hypothetical protein
MFSGLSPDNKNKLQMYDSSENLHESLSPSFLINFENIASPDHK